MSDTKKPDGTVPGGFRNTNGFAYGPGQTVDGAYLLLSIIGEGGMGLVFRAQHQMLDQVCALKILSAASASDEDLRRFEIEVRTLAKIQHPGIVKVFNMGRDRGTYPYYAMELLHGESLSDHLKEHKTIEPAFVLAIFKQLALALASAHSLGIVHRDIKPSNVMLLQAASGNSKAPLVKLVDFGIARFTQAKDVHKQALTAPGMVLGTPLYMSPEQSRGEIVDKRSDIYSLGCSMFEALTGVPPFRGANAFITLDMHQNQEPPWLSQIYSAVDFGDGLEEMVARMLRKNPQERYQSMEQIVQDIERLEQGRPIGAGATTGFESQDAPLILNTREVVAPSLYLWAIAAIVIFGFIVASVYGAQWLSTKPAPTVKAPVVEMTESMRLPEVKNDEKTPAVIVNQHNLLIKPAATASAVQEFSNRTLSTVWIDGEFAESNWTPIFAVLAKFKKTDVVKMTGLRLDKEQTAAIQLPPTANLFVSNCRLDMGSERLRQFWPELNSLILEKIEPFEDAGKEEMILLTDRLFSQIGADNHLSNFTVTRMRFSAEGLNKLLARGRIATLQFGRCRLNTAMLKAICHSPGVKSVQIYETFFGFEQIKEAITGASSLKQLSLTRPILSASELADVRQRFPDFVDPSKLWTKDQIATIQRMGVKLKFTDTNYIYVPQIDDWSPKAEMQYMPIKFDPESADNGLSK